MAAYRTGSLAKKLGVTPQTVRAWVRDEKVPYHRLPSGQLFFTEEDYLAISGEKSDSNDERWVYYVRSSSGGKSSLANQEQQLRDGFPEPIKVIKDIASGLNENRRGLKSLMEMAESGKLTDLAISYPDRLGRFGVKYLESYFSILGVRVHYLSESREQSAEGELIDDFMALIASFGGRLYKLRSKESSKKLLELAQKELESK